MRIAWLALEANVLAMLLTWGLGSIKGLDAYFPSHTLIVPRCFAHTNLQPFEMSEVHSPDSPPVASRSGQANVVESSVRGL
jgi:hypothetical protein